jgi:hypothetical protein
VAATLAAAGWGPADPARPGPGAVLATLAPATAGARTTALGATLLGLAARGLAPEPAGRLLDLGPAGECAWPAALRRLRRLGHSSGLAWAAGIAAALWSVAGDPAGGRDSVTAAANHTRRR